MKKPVFLPLFALILGLSCWIGRSVLYAANVDATGLLCPGSVLEWGSYLLTAAALVLFAVSAPKLETPVLPAGLVCFGQLIAALGFGWTAMLCSGRMPGIIGAMWKILGILCGVSLLISSRFAARKSSPPFLLSLIPCLFWLVHLIDHYQSWSGTPQLQSYLFPLLGSMAMMMFAYHTAALPVGMGNRRHKAFAAQAAGFFCISAALPGEMQMLYLSCALWALSSL